MNFGGITNGYCGVSQHKFEQLYMLTMKQMVLDRWLADGLLKRYAKGGCADEPAPEILYHYTTAAGLRGVLESRSIWATPAPFLNDTSEFNHGLAQLTWAAETLAEASNDEEHRARLRHLASHMTNAGASSSVWVCCLTKNCDKLSQWRGYTANGTGYAVGFRTEGLIGLLPACALYRIRYAARDSYATCKAVIEAAIKISAELQNIDKPEAGYAAANGGGWSPKESAEDWIAVMSDLLLATCAIHKDDGFAEEAEYRLVVFRPMVEGLEFHVGNECIVPHHPLASASNETAERLLLPISRIVIGPNVRRPENAKLRLELFLRQFGYELLQGDDRVVADPSNIPYLS